MTRGGEARGVYIHFLENSECVYIYTHRVDGDET